MNLKRFETFIRERNLWLALARETKDVNKIPALLARAKNSERLALKECETNDD